MKIHLIMNRYGLLNYLKKSRRLSRVFITERWTEVHLTIQDLWCNEKIKQKDIGDIYEQFLEKDILLQRAIHEIERYLYATFKYELILEEKLYLSIRTKVLMD